MYKDCSKELDVTYKSVVNRMHAKKIRFPNGLISSSVDVNNFKEQFDAPKQIQEALVELALNHRVIYEADLRLELHIPNEKFFRASRLPKFEKNKMQIKGKTIWGSKKDLQLIKKQIDVA